jgi:hypothetical protein
MTLFRLFLAICLIAIVAYTSATIANHGWNLLPVFFGDMAKMGWAGQFNLDFMTMLALSAIWVAWRHQFSAGGLALSVLAFFGGMMFLSIYLLVHSHRTRGDVKVLLLGEARARGA